MTGGKKLSSVVAMLALTGSALAAQTKTITGETKSVTATVEAIEKAGREITVKKPDGSYDVFYAPASMKRFDTLKIGDKITAKYYENIVLQLKPAGQKAVDTDAGGVTRAKGAPATTTAHQRTITATIT